MKVRTIAKAAQERATQHLLRQYSIVSCKTYHPDCADCQVALRARRNWGLRYHYLGEQIAEWERYELEGDLWMRLFHDEDLTAYNNEPTLWDKAIAHFNEQCETSCSTPAEALQHYKELKALRQ